MNGCIPRVHETREGGPAAYSNGGNVENKRARSLAARKSHVIVRVIPVLPLLSTRHASYISCSLSRFCFSLFPLASHYRLFRRDDLSPSHQLLSLANRACSLSLFSVFRLLVMILLIVAIAVSLERLGVSDIYTQRTVIMHIHVV